MSLAVLHMCCEYPTIVVCAKMADRINWEALRSACKDLNLHDLDEVHDFTSAGYTSTSSSSAATPAVTTAEGESDGHVFQAVNVAATVAPVVVQEADLKALHHVLFEIHVLEGELVCPESGRRFFVRDGIPNMLLHEDELGTGPEPVVPESKSEDSAAVVSSSSS